MYAKRPRAACLKSRLRIVVLILLGVCQASSGHAADPSQVEDLIRRGVELRRVGNDTGALPLFKKAYDLAPTPRTVSQLGLVEMALGYQLEAERHIMEGLASSSDYWVRKNHPTLEASLRDVRQAIGELSISGSPSGAEVSVNGNDVGKLPLSTPVRVGRGPASVTVRATGFVSQTTTVSIVGGRSESVRIQLLRRAESNAAPLASASTADAASKVDLSAPPPAKEAPPKTEPPAAEESPAASDDDGSALRPVAWVMATAAAGAFGFGVWQTFSWQDKQKQFNSLLIPSVAHPDQKVVACGTNSPHRGNDPLCEPLYNDFTAARTRAVVGYVIGGGLAIGAITFFVLSSKTREPAGPTALACSPQGFGMGLTCAMTF